MPPDDKIKQCLLRKPLDLSACFRNEDEQPPQKPTHNIADLERILIDPIDQTTPQKWLDIFGTFLRQSVLAFDGIPKDDGYGLNDLSSSLSQQISFLKSLTDHNEHSKRLGHLLNIASLATQLGVETRKRLGGEETEAEYPGGQDDEMIVYLLNQLENFAYSDKKLDSDERYILASIAWYLQSEDILTFPLVTLIRDNKHQPIIYTRENERYVLHVNNGPHVIEDTPFLDQAFSGYKEIDSKLLLFYNPRIHIQCYEFALAEDFSKTTGTALVDYNAYEKFIEKNYRPIDTSKEPARVGDIIVYLVQTMTGDETTFLGSKGWSSPHMARVSMVDEKGLPTHVMSKMGMDDLDSSSGKPIKEHPIDQALLRYGTHYMKPLKN